MRAPSRIAGFFAVLLAVSGAPLERSSAQIVYQYQYAAKVVCGRTDQLNPVVPQTYATSINVNNPNDSLTLFLRKWLVVTFPPGGQRAMQPTKALNDSLLNRFALTSDCRDIRQRFGVTAALFEGFLVVQSTQPLDVVGVYTVPGGIEVVPVTERRVYVGR